jgi:hypothetical protein
MDINMDEYKTITRKILDDYSSKLAHQLGKGEDYWVYYKNGGDTVNVLTVINRDDDSDLLNKIYNTQANILQRYVLNKKDDGINVNFRVLPTYNQRKSKIIPTSFTRYNAKSQLQKV